MTWRSRLPASIATWFSRDLVRPALTYVDEGGVTLRSVDDGRIVATVRSNGIAPEVSIEWAGGTGPQGIRAVCACGGNGVCAHVVAALEAVRTHVDAYEAAQSEEADGALDWLPPSSNASVSRARKIWPVFFASEGSTLACALFLDTPRLRGVLREGETIASMLDQTPPDDWDEEDRNLVRDPALRDAFSARPNSRALAQIMFRLSRHPRIRFDDEPDGRRHPEELPVFEIDPRGVQLSVRFSGARPIPQLLTSAGRRVDLSSAIVLDGPPAWIADAKGAYLLEGTLDASRAARAIEAARYENGERIAKPTVQTLARVAQYLPPQERERLGIVEAHEPVGRLVLAWRDGVLLAHALLRDSRTGATIEITNPNPIAALGADLVHFSPEHVRKLYERLVAAGFVPRSNGEHAAFALHSPQRAAEFVRETLPGWTDLEIELDRGLASLRAPQKLGLSVAARRSALQEDWFELDVGVWFDEGEPLSRAELSAILSGSGNYADVRGKLVDVSALRARDELLQDLLGRKESGLAALVALRDEIHAAFGQVRLPEEVEALRERVRNFAGIPRVVPPAAVSGVLRHYQERGLDFLSYLGGFRFGGILADDMGLGKTISTLAYLLHRKETDGPAPSLVIAPTSVTHTWAAEIAKFTPQLSLLSLESGNDRAAHYDEIENYDVIVTSYTLARLDAEKLARTRFRTIVLDEAQNAKNPSSQVSKVVRTLRADHRLALTGTPVENSLRDLWAIFAFLEPGLLGNESSFRRRFEVPIAGGDRKAVETLHARLEPFVLRRTKEDVTPELPERTESEIVVDLSPTQRRLYRAIAESARRELLEWDAESRERGTIHVLAALTRLRQVCAHPGLLAKQYLDEPESSAKFDALTQTIDEILAGNHKVLVFSSFASMLRLIRAELERREIPFGYLDGSVKEKDRREQVASFMSRNGPPVFLCSLKAGGVGLTLTAADYVILYDPWWNPAAERQAIDRTHRIGQKHAVTAYRLLARGTVEEKIRALAARKRQLSEMVVRADAAMAKALSREDLEFLLSEPV